MTDGRKVAIVTGASRGIGRGIATELAKTHAVVATYREGWMPPNRSKRKSAARFSLADVSSGEIVKH